MSTAIQKHAGDVVDVAAHTEAALSPSAVLHQVSLIQEVMGSVMKEGEHYGKIPGCGPKPTLLKPGAEKLSLTFRLAPRYHGEREPIDLGNGHREYVIRCELVHIPTGQFFGEGVGSCSTMESKYRYRKAQRVCPECGAEAIIKGKREYGGGWVCFKKKGGCGAKWADGAEEIESQPEGRAENEDLADTYNTVLKMAKKRAHVDAILTATAASDLFTQDVEDLAEQIAAREPAAPAAPAPSAEEPVEAQGTAAPQERRRRRPQERPSRPATPSANGHANQTDVFTPPEEQPDYKARALKCYEWLIAMPAETFEAARARAGKEVADWPDAVRPLGERAVAGAVKQRAELEEKLANLEPNLTQFLSEGADPAELRTDLKSQVEAWPAWWRERAEAVCEAVIAGVGGAYAKGQAPEPALQKTTKA